MEKLISPNSRIAQQAPRYVRQRAKQQGKQILHIIWDRDGGYPAHAWGYEQWSIRPYELGYGCDGTTDGCIHCLAMKICETIGLNYVKLYNQAYPDEELSEQGWWEPYISQVVMPKTVNQTVLCLLLHDLEEINNRSVLAVLQDKFEELGYNVDRWWEVLRP